MYYAVIFTSKQSENTSGYAEMSQKMEDFAKKQKGFLGIESAHSPETSGGITVSYWETLEDIKNWKAHTEHLIAQQTGREQWYDWYRVKICKVEREYEFVPRRESLRDEQKP